MKIYNHQQTFNADRSRLETPRQQDPNEVAAYYAKAKVGDKAALMSFNSDRPTFCIVTISRIKSAIGRIYITPGHPTAGNSYFRKSGKSSAQPSGTTRLVAPTPEIEAIARPMTSSAALLGSQLEAGDRRKI